MNTLKVSTIGMQVAGAAVSVACVAVLAIVMAGPPHRAKLTVRPPVEEAPLPQRRLDVSAVWKQDFNITICPLKESPLRASIEGTMRGPAGSWAAVTGADGKQVVVHSGAAFPGAIVSAITGSGVTLTSGSRTVTLPVDRNSK